MASNISVDSDLVDLALDVSGEATKTAVVTKALREFIAVRRNKHLRDQMNALEWPSISDPRR